MPTSPIVIAGAGIGGLTVALTLHQRGTPVTVVERAAHLNPVGVGVNLLPHAVRELDAGALPRCSDTAAVVAANRDMHRHTGPRTDDIARATARYRDITERSPS